LAAQLRLRRQMARQDELVSAYFRAGTVVERAESRLAAVRSQCEARLRAAQVAREVAAGAQLEALVALAAVLGDQGAAEVLELSLNRVRMARRARQAPREQNSAAPAPEDGGRLEATPLSGEVIGSRDWRDGDVVEPGVDGWGQVGRESRG
jgi:hypothetical protein